MATNYEPPRSERPNTPSVRTYDQGGIRQQEAPAQQTGYHYGAEYERQLHRERAPQQQQDASTAKAVVGGSTLELLGGAAAVVLGVLGLSGILPFAMACIAVLCAGGAVLIHGGALAARYSHLMNTMEGGRYSGTDLGGGLSAGILGGLAAIGLSILALVDVLPMTLLPVSAIVLGAALLFSGISEPELAETRLSNDASPRARQLAGQAIRASGAAMVLAGLGASVLGILALVDVVPVVPAVLISMLATGGALLLGGTSLVVRFARALSS